MTTALLVREAVELGLTGRPTCWLCGGTGVVWTGGHCTHGLRHRGEAAPCTKECVRAETCSVCFGTGIKEANDR